MNEYDSVIAEESSRLHSRHPSIFSKLVNAAICAQGSSSLSEAYLLRAREIADENADLFNEETRSYIQKLLQQLL